MIKCQVINILMKIIVSARGGAGGRFISGMLSFLIDNTPLTPINPVTGSSHGALPYLFPWYDIPLVDKAERFLNKTPTYLLAAANRDNARLLSFEWYLDNITDTELLSQLAELMAPDINIPEPTTLRTHLNCQCVSMFADVMKLQVYLISILPTHIEDAATVFAYTNVKNRKTPSDIHIREWALLLYKQFFSYAWKPPVVSNNYKILPYSIIRTKDVAGLLRFITQVLSDNNININTGQIDSVTQYMKDYFAAQLL